MTSGSVNSQSSNDPKGLRIVLERIEREAREKTGILNLGGLVLVEPPPELFQLQHLRCLSLGRFEFGENEDTVYREEDDYAPNQILRGWDQLASLPQLILLGISEVHCYDLSPFAGLTNLGSLDCSVTQVRDLAAD